MFPTTEAPELPDVAEADFFDRVVSQSRRLRRRRQLATGGAAATLAALALVVGLLLSGDGSVVRADRSNVADQGEHASAPTQGAAPSGQAEGPANSESPVDDVRDAAAAATAGLPVPSRGVTQRPEDAPPVSPNGRVAFLRYDAADVNQLWVMDPDGANARQLTRHAEHHWAPAWSPDGKTLAYARGREVRAVGVDGSGDRLVAAVAEGSLNDVEWSPGGDVIAFVVGNEVGTEGDLWEADAAGGTPRRVLADVVSFDWSPSGTQFVVSNRANDVKVVGRDGSGGTVVGEGYSPDWSPDGLRIAFAGTSRVEVVNADGSGWRAVSTPSSQQRDDRPTWLSNGSLLFVRSDSVALSCVPPAMACPSRTVLWSVSLDDGAQRQAGSGDRDDWPEAV